MTVIKRSLNRTIVVIVGLPQVEVTHNVSAIELETWNPGAPLRVVVDAEAPRAKCFEIGLWPNDSIWEGWKAFQIPLWDDARGEVFLDRPIIPPSGSNGLS